MSDADTSRRPKSAAPGQRTTRFEARQQPLPPPPRPMAKALDLPEDLPEPRPRPARRPAGATSLRVSSRRLVVGEERDIPAPAAQNARIEAAADLHRAMLIEPRIVPIRPILPVSDSRRSLFELFWGNPWLALLVGAACFVIYLLVSTPSRTVFSNYTKWGDTASASVSAALAPAPYGQHSVLGAPTITGDDVDAVLRQYNSPAVGSGHFWIEAGKRYGIDPAYALAFFIHESTAGTNSGWAGLKPDGGSTHNIGNIICAGYPTCFGRFRDYATWDEGIEDWYKLIANEYVGGRGAQTVEQIIPIYAPANDNNDVANYIHVVVSTVDDWHRQGVSR
jgi:hypothetical protein